MAKKASKKKAVKRASSRRSPTAARSEPERPDDRLDESQDLDDRLEEPERPVEPELGIRCRSCGCRHMPVFSTRRRPNQIIRIRVCRFCGKRNLTREKLG